MITDWASEEIDIVAAEFEMTRSDLIERLVRAGGLSTEKTIIQILMINLMKKE